MTPISTFPVAPPPRINPAVPAVEYAIAAPQIYPAKRPSVGPRRQPVVPAGEYAVAAPPVYPTRVPSVAVEVVKSTPPVVPVVPSSGPSYPVKNEYIVKSPPFVTHIVPPAVSTSQAPPTTAPTSIAPPPAAHVAVPSVPAQRQYAVAEVPVYPVAAVPVTSVAPAYVDTPVYTPAPTLVHSIAIPSVAPSVAAYAVEDPPVYAAGAAFPHVISSRLVEPVHAVETPVVDHAVPVVTPDPAGPSGKNECVTKCHKECQKGDSQCLAACLQTCHSAKMLGSTGLAGTGKLLNGNAETHETHDDNIPTTNAKAAAKPAADAPTLAAGAGFQSFDACMASCKKKFQTADIAFTISQGKSDCVEACAGYSAEGAGVTAAKRDVEAKRAVEPVAGALRPAAPALTAGAGSASFEACMKECHGKWQSANIAFDISQGKNSCKKACAQFAKNGSGVSFKRAVEPVAGALRPTGPELAAGAGFASFDACMKDCGGRWQSANIVFDIDQGRKNCKAACAAYDSNGSGAIIKKEAADAAPAIKKTTRDFPFEEGTPLNKTPKDGPFTKTPETTAGASTSNYEACMHGCGVKLQSADIAFEVEQGDTQCATRCARYSSNGAGITHV
ncbi:hypothetical protein F4801DRAFT_537216 [Xylaria longipes]|nr:hypothetical protein F4801DRAFT_537216 [Xylaria longipes]